MAKEIPFEQLLARSRKANEALDVLNDARSRLVNELKEALKKAFDEGKSLEGVGLNLVFAAKTAPVVEPVKEPEMVEVNAVEVEVEDEGEEPETETEETEEVEAVKKAKPAAKKKAKK